MATNKHLETTTMNALVFNGPGKPAWVSRPKPTLQAPTDAIVRITTTTICGSDLHILAGHVPSVTPGRILGHEGVGIIEEVGAGIVDRHVGDRVIISCITSCGRCDFCRKQMFSHCRSGGWMLGNTIDGTQAEYVRVPFADTSLYTFPSGADEEAMVMLSDILPTGYECGVLCGQVKPGDTVAIVGAGPVGLAALLTAQFFTPARLVMIDIDDNRLAVARSFGATDLVNNTDGGAAAAVMALTQGAGVDVAIEAVGSPGTFDVCQAIIAPGGHIANIGVHGSAVKLEMERLWHYNITLTTRLVDTVSTPVLRSLVTSGRLDAKQLVTHRFQLSEIIKAYDSFGNAAREKALKVILSRSPD